MNSSSFKYQLTGKHWSEYQKKGISSSKHEAKVTPGVVIPLSDQRALCNKEGWETYQREKRALMGEVRWIYEIRGTELEIWAKTRADAANSLRQYGVQVDESKVRQVPESPQDVNPLE